MSESSFDAIEKFPLPSVTVVTFELFPSIYNVIILSASAVPSKVGVLLLVALVIVVIVGLIGAFVSISITCELEAIDVFPAGSVEVTVKL